MWFLNLPPCRYRAMGIQARPHGEARPRTIQNHRMQSLKVGHFNGKYQDKIIFFAIGFEVPYFQTTP